MEETSQRQGRWGAMMGSHGALDDLSVVIRCDRPADVAWTVRGAVGGFLARASGDELVRARGYRHRAGREIDAFVSARVILGHSARGSEPQHRRSTRALPTRARTPGGLSARDEGRVGLHDVALFVARPSNPDRFRSDQPSDPQHTRSAPKGSPPPAMRETNALVPSGADVVRPGRVVRRQRVRRLCRGSPLKGVVS
jgi:hypothetical protein